MIALAPWLVAAAFFIGTSTLFALGLRLLRPVLRRIESPTVHALLVASPVLVSFVATAALLVPGPFGGGCHCATHQGDHPHVCLSHPELSATFVLPAVIVLAAWLVAAAPRLRALGRDLRVLRRWSSTVRDAPIEEIDGREMRLVDAPRFGAFTIGTLAPRMACDRALWSRLTDVERRAVVLHEEAHLARRDGLTLIALRLAVCVTPFYSHSLADWRRAAERACDGYAAMITGDPLIVAESLLGCARSQRAHATAAEIQLALGALGDIEDRVRALLALPAPLPRRAPVRDLFWVAAACVALLVACLASPRHFVHDSVETAMGGFEH